MKLIFHERAWDDDLYWQANDAKILARLNGLTLECVRTPFAGIGKPEPLRELRLVVAPSDVGAPARVSAER